MHIPDFATLQHFDAFPWMVAVKLEMWNELAAEALPDSGLTYAQGLWHYAQGVRRARTGDATGARAELAALRTVMADSVLQQLTLGGINRAANVLKVAEHVLEGEVLAVEGKMNEAIEHLTAAAIQEDSLQYQEPPD